jgi:Mg-chelatase subunit ChlD
MYFYTLLQVTRAPLFDRDLVPNRSLKSSIEERQQQLGQSGGAGAEAAASGGGGAFADQPKPPLVHDADIKLSVQSVAAGDDVTVLMQVTPPSGPSRVPMDVCCVIDTSGSMCAAAKAPDDGANVEDDGLSLLDVVKHAVATLTMSLGPEDRMSIVSYSSTAITHCELVSCAPAGQARIKAVTNLLKPDGRTNLWEGVRQGLEALKRGSASRDGRGTVLMLLTDGVPNVEPPRGSVEMLKRFLQKNPDLHVSLNTFGFGYELDSDMLNNLAYHGNGTYAFIPDPGFVGTVFVHAFANATVMMARNVSIELKPAAGCTFDEESLASLDPEESDTGATIITLPMLQYEQPKDMLVKMKVPAAQQGGEILSIQVTWTNVRDVAVHTTTVPVIGLTPGAGIDIAGARTALVDMIWAAIDCASTKNLPGATAVVQAFIANTEKLPTATNKKSAVYGLLQDARGQISTAVSKQEFYDKWGQHYLPSLANSHMLQLCTNFKDPGVQVYGGAMFKEVRDLADDIFCELPPPTPSRRRAQPVPVQVAGGPPVRAMPPPPQVDMSRYNNRSAGCFGGDCVVEMADGRKQRVRDARRGDKVMTTGPDGGTTAATVLCVVETICPLGVNEVVELPTGLKITPYHPVRTAAGEWRFPGDLESVQVIAISSVFTFVLDKGHIAIINGVECVTLGHGFDGPIVGHPFFGSPQVVDDLRKQPGWNVGLVVLQPEAYRRSATTGMIAAIRSVDVKLEHLHIQQDVPATELFVL